MGLAPGDCRRMPYNNLHPRWRLAERELLRRGPAAGAGLRWLEAPVGEAALAALPLPGGEELDDVGAADDADQLVAVHHRHPTDAVGDEEPGRLSDRRVGGDCDRLAAHDVAHGLAPTVDDVELGDHPDQLALAVPDRQ